MPERKMSPREALNAKIAEHFGFKKSEGEEYLCGGSPPGIFPKRSGQHPQWTYPKDWYLPQCGTPNICIPDFLEILEDQLKLMKKHENGGPREYFGLL